MNLSERFSALRPEGQYPDPRSTAGVGGGGWATAAGGLPMGRRSRRGSWRSSRARLPPCPQSTIRTSSSTTAATARPLGAATLSDRSPCLTLVTPATEFGGHPMGDSGAGMGGSWGHPRPPPPRRPFLHLSQPRPRLPVIRHQTDSVAHSAAFSTTRRPHTGTGGSHFLPGHAPRSPLPPFVLAVH